MKICKNCGKEFRSTVIIDGVRRSLTNRKYCLECSPFGRHNTKKILGINEGRHKCYICGEIDPTKFYGHKTGTCGKCQNKQVIQKGKENKKFAIEYLGGKCVSCGFDKYPCSLDIHHKDPEEKDSNFNSYKGWSRDRLIKELDKCVLLCSNCHNAYHNGYLDDNFNEIKFNCED